jgi:hypothetical protein
MKTRAVIGLPCALAALLAACGGSPSAPATSPTATATTRTPTPVPTPNIPALAQQYLALVAPYNSAVGTFQIKYNALPNSPSMSQLNAICSPMATALQTYIDGVLRLPLPASILPDAHALATMAGTVEADLNNVGNPTVNAWSTKLLQDFSQASTAANVLRSDLGLPPPPSSPTP